MQVVNPTADHVITTPNATMTRLAAPSLGSKDLAVWRARMEPGQQGPEHVIDQEQVWVVLSGTLAVHCGGESRTARTGEAVVMPADVPRQFGTVDEPVEVLVSMRVPAAALIPETGERRTVPWAE